MVLRPVYYLADFMTGDLYGEALPLENVQLSSSLEPGSFTADLDMRKLGPLGDGYRVMNLLANGKCTLVPVLEGLSAGVGNTPVSRALGEWWVSVYRDNPPSPIVQISGPEFAGYTKEVLITASWVGSERDPVMNARAMLRELYNSSQTVAVDLQNWVSGAREPIDARQSTVDYWTAISELQDAEQAPFEWMIRTGLALDGGSTTRVTRTLEVGQPRLAFNRPDVTLELAGPGQGPASLLGFSRERSEHRSATTVYGWGAGSGDDQIGGGGVFTSRNREPGEPVKTRQVTDRAAMTAEQLRRKTRASLRAALPTDQVFQAVMPTDRYTPMVGEVYSWRTDAQWTRQAESGSRRCVGWSWSSGQADDVYQLDLTGV